MQLPAYVFPNLQIGFSHDTHNKITLDAPKTDSGLAYTIMMGKSICRKWVKLNILCKINLAFFDVTYIFVHLRESLIQMARTGF